MEAGKTQDYSKVEELRCCNMFCANTRDVSIKNFKSEEMAQ